MRKYNSISQGVRQSNIELLRIIAMFLVLVVHCDFWAIGEPTIVEYSVSPLNAWIRTIIESLSIVCVNIFILISGWFGIKYSLKGFGNFIFQCLYFIVGIYVVMIIIGENTISLKGIASCLCLSSANWFIMAYVGLYVCAPILNTFLEKSNKKQVAYFLLGFYLFQTIWGWSGAARYIEGGYSTFSFIGLYVIARFMRIHYSQVKKNKCILLYLLCVLINSILYFLSLKYYGQNMYLFLYVNPLVVIGSISLFIWFTKIHIKNNKCLNWCAKSAFAVYLLHCNPNISERYFKPICEYLYSNFQGLRCLILLCCFLILVFIISIIFDQPRIILWKYLSKAT